MHLPTLSDNLYLLFRELLHDRCGLYYPERKRADLAHGLSQALAASGFDDLQKLYTEAVRQGPAWDLIVQHLTIGETYFFRNEAQFEALRYRILPELLARRAATRTLRVWSAGCASGEEPYSVAMLLRDLLPQPDQWQINLLATDINPHFLERAREGLYNEWSFRDTPQLMRQRYFTREAAGWRINLEIRRMVSFARLNLVEEGFPSVVNGTAAVDLLLCRNVTIYFDEATTQRLAVRLFQALTAGGWLIIGHSEPHAGIYRQFELHNFPGTVVYRKPLGAPSFPPLSEWDAATRPAAAAPAPRHEARPAIEPAAGPGGLQPDVPLRSVAGEPGGIPARQPEPQRPQGPGSHDQGYVAALLALARTQADRGELQAAEHDCRRALDHDPLQAEGHYLLAQLLEQRDDLEGALAAYRRCIFLDQGYAAGLLGMAQVWGRLGEPAQARRCYRNALQLLAQMPPSARVAGMEDVSAGELQALVVLRLEQLEQR